MTSEQIASDLLFPLWKSVSVDYKAKYKFDAWQHFENFVVTSANSQDLKAFLSKLKRLIDIKIQQRYESLILSVLQYENGGEIMKDLRQNTPYLILLTRDLNSRAKDDIFESRIYELQLDYNFAQEEIDEILSNNGNNYKKAYGYLYAKYVPVDKMAANPKPEKATLFDD